MLEKAEREAKEAATAVSVARSRSTTHAARYSLPVGNNGGGYTRLLDDPEAGEQLSVADPAVSCTGVPPAEARDGDSVALTADQVSDPLGLLGRGEETEFSIAPASRQPYLSGKSDIHWIPMIDIVGGTKRVNLRFLLVSQRLHARVVCRLPLVLVLWFLLILLETAAFFVWAPPQPPPPAGEEPRAQCAACYLVGCARPGRVGQRPRRPRRRPHLWRVEWLHVCGRPRRPRRRPCLGGAAGAAGAGGAGEHRY